MFAVKNIHDTLAGPNKLTAKSVQRSIKTEMFDTLPVPKKK